MAYQPALFIEGVPALDRGGIRLSAARRRELAREPNGDNSRAVGRQVCHLLEHPKDAQRLLGLDTPLVWVHDPTDVAATGESQGNLIEATKRRCAQLGIDYGRDARVPFDVVARQVAKHWTHWFVIRPGGPRPRDEAKRARRSVVDRAAARKAGPGSSGAAETRSNEWLAQIIDRLRSHHGVNTSHLWEWFNPLDTAVMTRARSRSSRRIKSIATSC